MTTAPRRLTTLAAGGLLLAGGAAAFNGCAPRGGAIADAAAVSEVAALDGAPLPAHEWTTDLEAARRQAAAEGKDVLMLFTGSDWCPPCQALEANVFAQAPASRLEDDVVPVMLDFPRGKPQPPEVAARNDAISDEYGVDSFPTVLLTTADGKRYGRLEGWRYSSGEAAAFVADVRAMRREKGGVVTADDGAGAASL